MHKRHREPRSQPLELFDERVTVLYNSMAGRKAVARAGGLPFTRAEFRHWLLTEFQGNPENVVKCAYCNTLLNIVTAVIDHKRALAAGGSPGLENLTLSCASDNRRKGQMSESGFRALIDWGVMNLDRYDFNDMMGRLATGGEGAKLMWRRKAAKAKATEPF